MTESSSYATRVPFLRCTDSPSVAVVRCKMRGWLVVVVLMATLVSQRAAQYTCKFRTNSLGVQIKYLYLFITKFNIVENFCIAKFLHAVMIR